ncbi:endospore germination permease [Bacillus cereus]|nr:endospore germination permease [Bacillus cereus]
MMNVKGQFITPLQFILGIHSTQTAAGILLLPSVIAGSVGTDGWITIILGWICTNIIGIFIILTMLKNPAMDFPGILIHYFGKWIGNLLLALYSIHFILVGFLALLRAIDVVKVWILPQTPSYQIVFLLLIPFYILGKDNIISVCKYNEIIFFLTLFLPVILIFSLKTGFHPIHLLPILKEGWIPIFKGLKDTLYSYSGLEISYILYPFLQKKEKALKGILIANTLTMLLILYVTLLCFLHFSPKGMQTIIWPGFSLLKGIQFSFLERFEILYVAYYSLMFSTTIIPYFFCATYTITHISTSIKTRFSNVCLIIFMTLIFIFVKFGVDELIKVYSFINITTFAFFIILPTLFLICSYSFPKKNGWKNS